MLGIHWEPTAACQAHCPQCARNIRGGSLRPGFWRPNNWITPEQFQCILDAWTTQVSHHTFCGNFGDPAALSHLPLLVAKARQRDPDAWISINTNGGLQTPEWWRGVAKILGPQGHVTWSIDGLEDTLHLYRKGVSWHRVVDNLQAFVNAGGQARWDWLEFQHNQHQTQQAHDMALQWGVTQFNVKHTSRFGDKSYIDTDWGTRLVSVTAPDPDVIELVANKQLLTDWVNRQSIQCRSILGKEVYIDSARRLFPCCWIGQAWSVGSRFMNQSNMLQDMMPESQLLIPENNPQKVWDLWIDKLKPYWRDRQRGIMACSRACKYIK